MGFFQTIFLSENQRFTDFFDSLMTTGRSRWSYLCFACLSIHDLCDLGDDVIHIVIPAELR